MATITKGIRVTDSGTFEASINHPSLPGGRITRTFTSLEDASRYRSIVLANLDTGMLESAEVKSANSQVPAKEMLTKYLQSARIATTDRPTVRMLTELNVRVCDIDLGWAEGWIKTMKAKQLAPGTIRKRVESLSRALDWWNRTLDPKSPAQNPLRSLPRGYSTYHTTDGIAPRFDQERDRRLHEGEEGAIEAAIMGWRNPERQRPLPMQDRDDFLVLFKLLINTGLRLREAYRLTAADVDLKNRIIRVTKSKTGVGRSVPLNRAATAVMTRHMAGLKRDRVFPWWHGSEDHDYLSLVSARLSGRFRTLFDYVGSKDLREHDLRHEAVCRWMLMRDANGGWLYRPEEVRKITGHKSQRVFERYLSLRGTDLVRD